MTRREKEIYREAYDRALSDEYTRTLNRVYAECGDHREAMRIAQDNAQQTAKDAAEAAASEYRHNRRNEE